MQALIGAAQRDDYPAEIVAVIANRPDALGLDYARQAGIPTAVVDHKSFSSKLDFETALDRRIKGFGAELVCLAGFMRILSPWMVQQWHDRLLNIHPSLLPSFPGLDTHERALAAGVRIHGCTVHRVRDEVDGGPIVAQAAVPVSGDDTEETLAARVLAAEHILYPHALALVAASARSQGFEEHDIDDTMLVSPKTPG